MQKKVYRLTRLWPGRVSWPQAGEWTLSSGSSRLAGLLIGEFVLIKIDHNRHLDVVFIFW